MDIVTIGLFFGDETKGSIVDFLVFLLKRNVIRYCGGSQCAHNVMIDEIHHSFSQFGSASFLGGKTILTRYMLVDPLALMYEAEQLQNKGVDNPCQMIFMSENCLIITPFQIICGIAKEKNREIKHGSCAKGVGETVRDFKTNPEFSIKAHDLKSDDLICKLNSLKAMKLDQIEQLGNAAAAEGIKSLNKYETRELARMYSDFAKKVKIVSDKDLQKMVREEENIWEGGQGTLLDFDYGFKPFVTKTNTTEANAIKLLSGKKAIKLGIMRAYGTRHGAGPFPSEEIGFDLGEIHNRENWSQGGFRQGWLDLVLIKYAILVNNGIDQIALTCLDKLSKSEEIKVCLKYEYLGKETRDMLEKYFNFDDEDHIIGLKIQKQDETIARLLDNCRPIYLSLPGWKSDISTVTCPGDLPKETVGLINYIEEQLGVPISIVSVGPDRSQKMFLKNDLNRGFC